MSGKRETAVIRCMSCGREKAYPDGFPGIDATCWGCAMSAHMREAHRGWWRRKVTKPAKRRALERMQREETAKRIDEAVTESQANAIAFGTELKS